MVKRYNNLNGAELYLYKMCIRDRHSALHDVLTHYGVIKDDSADIVLATDGSRVRYDKDSPRTEVEITALNELSYKENKEVKNG